MQLFDFIHLFDSLNKTGISSSYVSDTLFAKQFADSHERDFLASAITSHLQTHCCSVVVGTNVDEINLWVNTLASFLMPLERNLCKLAIDTQLGKSDFVPELFVQGICFDAKKHAQIGKQNPPLWKMAVPIRGVLSGRYPITVIDLTQKVVMYVGKSCIAFTRYFTGRLSYTIFSLYWRKISWQLWTAAVRISHSQMITIIGYISQTARLLCLAWRSCLRRSSRSHPSCACHMLPSGCEYLCGGHLFLQNL